MLTRLAAAAATVCLGLLLLWQAGLIFSTPRATTSGLDGLAVDLQPADASIETPAVEGHKPGVVEGAVAPDFEFSAFDGRRLKLSDFRGRPLVVNFWASWCLPCRAEMPDLQKLTEDYAGQGFAVIAVNAGEAYRPAAEFVDKLGVKLTALAYDPDQSVLRRYGVTSGLPVSFFIDADGLITRVQVGQLTPGIARSAADEAVAGYGRY